MSIAVKKNSITTQLTLDGILGSRLEPGQGSDLGLPDEPEGVGHAQLPHHQLHGRPDLGRVGVAPVHHLEKRERFGNGENGSLRRESEEKVFSLER